MPKLSNRLGRLISRTLAALCAGLLCTIFILQYDPAIKQFIGQKIIAMFEKTINCTMHGHLKHINIFRPKICLSDVSAESKNNIWKWTCKKYILSFSWLHFLLYGVIELHVTVENMDATSRIADGKVAILEIIERVIAGIPQDIPLKLKSITFKQTKLAINDTHSNSNLSICWGGENLN